MEPKHDNPLQRLAERLRRAGPFAGTPSGEHPAEDTLFELAGGELEPESEAAVLAHLEACTNCRGAALAVIKAKEEAAREAGWPLERVQAMLAAKAVAAQAQPGPAPLLEPAIRLGRWVMNLLAAGIEGLEIWPQAEPALVRDAGGAPAPAGGSWIVQRGEVRLGIQVSSPRRGAGMPALSVELLEGNGAGYDLELIGEPDLLIESCPLRALEQQPLRLELPCGKAFLNLSSGGRFWTLLAWEMKPGGESHDA